MSDGRRLAARVVCDVARHGPLPFTRYMEAALYADGEGFYRARRQRVGRRGDFVTSPVLSSAFGRTLAALAPLVHAAAGRPDRLRIVDAGAGEGHLLAPLWAALDPALLSVTVVEAVIAERGEWRREAAASALAGIAARVRQVADVSELVGLEPSPGVVLANELFDALPVRRLRRSADGVEEAYVDVAGEGTDLIEIWKEIDGGEGFAGLPVGRECAVAIGVEELLGHLAAGIDRGLIAIIDYGSPASMLFAEEGPGNPARGFRGGTLIDDLLATPGEIDLTAHVDFTRLDRAARGLGLERVCFTDQCYLLMALGFLDDPAATTARRLIHPEDMGGAFKCLLLAKDLPRSEIPRLDLRDRGWVLDSDSSPTLR